MNFVELYQSKIDSDYFDNNQKDLLLSFFEEISKKNLDDFRFLSFQDIANIIHKKPYDSEIFELINTLESPQISFLIRKHIFIYDDFEEEIEPDDLEEIVSKDMLIHPETGIEVNDWKNHIFPFFVISPKAKEKVE